jgi:signal transduction histidine kinase
MGNRHKLIPVMVVPPTVPVVLMLIDSENAGNEFISIAAHELRNPIQPILGLAEVVRNKSIDSEQKQMLDIITRNARKLKNLSDTILEVSRAEKNTLKLNPEKIAIVQLSEIY